MARLRERYKKEIVPDLRKELGYENSMAVPSLSKIVVSMGVGIAAQPGNKNRIDIAAKELGIITGQKPIVTKARKAVAGFKLREDQEIGLKVTLRGARMYEFFDRLVSVVLPRIRDFRGLSPKSFDRDGNYSLGLTEQAVFPEISLDDIEHVQGMNVTIGVRARSRSDSVQLLKRLGLPLRPESKPKVKG